MRYVKIGILGAVLSFLPACSSKPSSTRTYPSSSPALSVVVEDFGGEGPLSSDTTQVYAVRISNGKPNRQLIVEGEYLGLSKVEWIGADKLTLYISSESMTSRFYNNVTLSDGSTSMKVHTTLTQIGK